MTDTYLTQAYKQGYIHSHYNRSLKAEVIYISHPALTNRSGTKDVATFKAAKAMITRLEKS